MSDDIIDLEDSMEDGEANEQMTNSDEDKLLEDQHQDCMEITKKDCVSIDNDQPVKKENEVTKNKTLEEDCVEIKDDTVMKNDSVDKMDTSEKSNKAQIQDDEIVECDTENSKTCDNLNDETSSDKNLKNCDKSDLTIIDLNDRSEVSNVSLDSKKGTLDEAHKTDEDISQVRKRRADSEDEAQNSGDLKRTRLDMVIGKLGNQIGISPNAVVCEDSSESEDSRTSESSKLSDAQSVHEDDEQDAARLEKKNMEIAEKVKTSAFDIYYKNYSNLFSGFLKLAIPMSFVFISFCLTSFICVLSTYLKPRNTMYSPIF